MLFEYVQKPARELLTCSLSQPLSVSIFSCSLSRSLSLNLALTLQMQRSICGS